MDNNRPCYSNRGSVFDQKNDNSNLSTSAVTIAGNMVHISNFWGEFDQQNDRNRGHYYGKYGSTLTKFNLPTMYLNYYLLLLTSTKSSYLTFNILPKSFHSMKTFGMYFHWICIVDIRYIWMWTYIQNCIRYTYLAEHFNRLLLCNVQKFCK